MTRAEFFVWLNSHRTLAELLERSEAIAELLSEGLAVAVYDDSDEIRTFDLTAPIMTVTMPSRRARCRHAAGLAKPATYSGRSTQRSDESDSKG